MALIPRLKPFAGTLRRRQQRGLAEKYYDEDIVDAASYGLGRLKTKTSVPTLGI